ncbi:hypothetical protein B0A52_10316 [Exophiala mesophila]|uniref:Uncharacterized protein n=1 Tax=Exophiala mesophila TaxID=212818 RepID=A0A438MQA5_EXOME|nr:hypothetical protein B0A52_10316 [Exophiala mesophila]
MAFGTLEPKAQGHVPGTGTVYLYEGGITRAPNDRKSGADFTSIGTTKSRIHAQAQVSLLEVHLRDTYLLHVFAIKQFHQEPMDSDRCVTKHSCAYNYKRFAQDVDPNNVAHSATG